MSSDAVDSLFEGFSVARAIVYHLSVRVTVLFLQGVSVAVTQSNFSVEKRG